MNRLFILISCVFSLLFAGCGLKKQEEKCIFVLFDISGSTLPSRPQYYQDFQKVLDKIKGGDRLVADLITENPLSQSIFPINEKIPKYSIFFPGGPDEYSTRTTQQKTNILNEAKRLVFNSTGRQKTKILDSLRLAERVFKTYKEPKEELIFFSDMVEESEYYDFTTMRLSDKEIEQIIEKEKKKGLPNLSGAKVYVAGATHSISGGMSTARILTIQNFWLRYFKECGADLTKERYGSCLLEYE